MFHICLLSILLKKSDSVWQCVSWLYGDWHLDSTGRHYFAVMLFGQSMNLKGLCQILNCNLDGLCTLFVNLTSRCHQTSMVHVVSCYMPTWWQLTSANYMVHKSQTFIFYCCWPDLVWLGCCILIREYKYRCLVNNWSHSELEVY